MKQIFAAAIALLALAACASPGQQATQFAMEKRACAELGIAPGSGSFTQCAVDLDATMFGLDHVQ